VAVTPFAIEKPDEVVPEENDFLAQAARCIERGDDAGAVPYLRKQIEAFPDQIMMRAYLAELLTRLKQVSGAKEQFERFIEAAQLTDGPAKKHQVHCHTRLMELAQERDDLYSEKLHRGIGLYLLAQQKEVYDEDHPELREQLLFKAIRELESAQEYRKREARPAWYAWRCWSLLDQPRPAERALQTCQKNAPFSDLTPWERSELRMLDSAKR
jgi:hypothetical protein